MAEALLNILHGDRYEARSAGITPTKINPYVVKAMAEIGIDISKNHSKNIEEFRGENFNYVVTVCDSAKEACPFFPGEKVIHKAFEDPSQFTGSEEEIMNGVRRVREEIREWLEKTFAQ
jgi:arsenate reductase